MTEQELRKFAEHQLLAKDVMCIWPQELLEVLDRLAFCRVVIKGYETKAAEPSLLDAIAAEPEPFREGWDESD